MGPSVKSKLFAVIVMTGLGPAMAFGAQVDSRFDGRWTGVEVFRYSNGFVKLVSKVPQVTATLAIGQSGQLFTILAGVNPGRYQISEKSHENTIVIKSLPRTCAFVLSRDGNTLKEHGSALLGSNYGMLNWQVTATFHRADK